jgi:hypothetical protein
MHVRDDNGRGLQKPDDKKSLGRFRNIWENINNIYSKAMRY